MAYIEVKDGELIYDRSRNISGAKEFEGIEEIACPTKGSSVEFVSKDKSLKTNDNYLNIIPIGINNLYANYKMVYEVSEEDAAALADFLESKLGTEPVFFDSDPTLYKKINGFCTNYSLNQIDVETFSISANFEITESPGHFNWTGMNFLLTENDSFNYEINGRNYKKHEVAYDFRLENLYQDKINNFYYCTEDHNSTDDVAANLEDSPFWTKDFFWEPDVGQSSNVQFDIERFGDRDGFPYRKKTKKNTAIFPLQYTFKNISTAQLKGMLHFLESRAGYKRFKHKIASVYNKPKVFICRKWTHTWVSFNSHDLTVSLEEDPLGVMPRRVAQTAETLSSRVFDQGNELIDSEPTDIPANWQDGDPNNIFDLKIGSACTSIGQEAFRNCQNLNGQLRVPGSVNTIGARAFQDCLGYDDSLIIGGAVQTIGDGAFERCNFTGDLIIPPSVTSIGNFAFNNCNDFNGKLEIGKNLTTLGTAAFRFVLAEASPLKIPSTIANIGQEAFRGCKGIRADLNIPEGVENILERAFEGCVNMGTKVYLPSTILTINGDAFRYCRRVYKIYIYAEDAPTIYANTFRDMVNLREINVPVAGLNYDVGEWANIDADPNIKLNFVL